MNLAIYNAKIASFREEVRELKKNILKRKIENVSDFNALFREVNSMISEYNALYYGFANPVNQEQFIKYMEGENDFLSTINNLTKILKEHHQKNGLFVEDYVIQKEWEHVKKIIEYNNCLVELRTIFPELSDFSNPKKIEYNDRFVYLNEKITKLELEKKEAENRIIELNKNTPKGEYKKDHEKIVKAQEEINQKGKEALRSIGYILETKDKNIETSTFSETVSIDKESIVIREEYLNSLPTITSKIEYVEAVLDNIERLPGKKVLKFKGSTETIAKSFRGRYLIYQQRLIKLKEQYEEEQKKFLRKIEEEHEAVALAEEEAREDKIELYIIGKNLQDIEEELFALGNEATPYINTNKVAIVASVHEEPFYVLKTKLEKFNKIFVEYKSLQKKYQKLANFLQIEPISTLEKWKIIEKEEKKCFEEIEFLKKQTETKETKSKINQLKNEIYKKNQSKEFALFVNIKNMLSTYYLNNNIRSFYEKIMKDPKKFLLSKDYANDEKRQIFMDLIAKTSEYIKKSQEKRAKDSKKPIKTKEIIENSFIELKRNLNLIPKTKKNVFKIKKNREANYKTKLAYTVCATATGCAFLLGLNVISYACNSTSSKKVFTANTKEFMTSNSSRISGSIEKDIKKVLNEENKQIQNVLKNTYSYTENELEDFKKEKIALEKVKKDVNQDNQKRNFDDLFTNKNGVYISQEDLLKEENKQPLYFSEDSLSTVKGIVYSYNGTSITIFEDDPEAKEKIKAIENHGAKQIGYVGTNLQAIGTGYEGFFANKDIQFVEEEGRSR